MGLTFTAIHQGVAQDKIVSVNDEALLKVRPARLLSEYGLFSDLGAQIPTEGILPYDLQVSLFTDYAHKYRFVYVPSGKTASYDETEVLKFPVGSVLIKTFAYPADFRKPDQNIRLIETRLLIHQEKGWNAWAYVWNDDQSDAVLKVAGKRLDIDWIDTSGNLRQIEYKVPNKNQCKGCHTLDKAFTPIGPKARNLNKDYAYRGGVENQLIEWTKQGVLESLPPIENVQHIPPIENENSDLNSRARAYLDINCAHCHRLRGPASTSGLFLTYGEKDPVHWGYKKRPVAAGRGSGGLSFDIDPGRPENSILHFRMHSEDPGIMMPETGRTIVHKEGLRLIHEWIEKLE
ncbi:hypothetical protein KFF44_00795 [Kordiimonas sp. SCSIO 12610]|nr:hypothetical protein KFF44_00795 [Kordiimonas sp. SCSIO 12610]